MKNKTRSVSVSESPTEFMSRIPKVDGWYILPKTGGMYATPTNTAPRAQWTELMSPNEYQATDTVSARWIIRRYEEKRNA